MPLYEGKTEYVLGLCVCVGNVHVHTAKVFIISRTARDNKQLEFWINR